MGETTTCNHGAMMTMAGPDHGLIPRCLKCHEAFVPASLLSNAIKERDQWKANHDEQVRQKRARAAALDDAQTFCSQLFGDHDHIVVRGERVTRPAFLDVVK